MKKGVDSKALHPTSATKSKCVFTPTKSDHPAVSMNQVKENHHHCARVSSGFLILSADMLIEVLVTLCPL